MEAGGDAIQTIPLNDIPDRPIQVAMVRSLFYPELTDLLLKGALKRLELVKAHVQSVLVVDVPGAFELPLMADTLLSSSHHKINPYDAVIALGVVMRGDTDHYRYVCEQVSQGCMRVGLATKVPVIFGVLTVENEAQAMARLGGEHGDKGYEAAEAALQMVHAQQRIRSVSCLSI